MSGIETGTKCPVVITRTGGDGPTVAYTVPDAAVVPTAFVLTAEQAAGLIKFRRGRASMGRLATIWGGWIAFALSMI